MRGVFVGEWRILVFICVWCGLLMVVRDGHAAGMQEMVGTWYAEVRENNSFNGKRYTIRRQVELNRPDGTKVVTFRHYDRDRMVGEMIITYTWGAANDVYWAVCQTEVNDGRVRPCDWRTEYDILSVDGQTLRYKSRSSGTVYNHKRVGDNFRLP